MTPDPRPIGMMDSGVGGLSVLRHVRRHLPNEDILYFADQGHVPYGPRQAEEIQRFVKAIIELFIRQEVKAVVVACNTASAAALNWVRREITAIPIVGMEPAIKPAAEQTRSGVIGVLATQTTSQAEMFASLIDRYARHVNVVTQVCPAFVTLVEKGELDTPATYSTAETYLRPLLDAGVDQIVLGCTHFAYLAPVIREIVGDGVGIIDPSPAVARQTGRVIAKMSNEEGHGGRTTYMTSGSVEAFIALAEGMVDGFQPAEAQVVGLRWEGDSLTMPEETKPWHIR